jgi:hypothetical protein
MPLILHFTAIVVSQGLTLQTWFVEEEYSAQKSGERCSVLIALQPRSHSTLGNRFDGGRPAKPPFGFNWRESGGAVESGQFH